MTLFDLNANKNDSLISPGAFFYFFLVFKHFVWILWLGKYYLVLESISATITPDQKNPILSSYIQPSPKVLIKFVVALDLDFASCSSGDFL